MLMLSHSVVQLIEEFKPHLAPLLTPLLASYAAYTTTINTIEKSAVSHFLVSY